jgi:hypothetical protein
MPLLLACLLALAAIAALPRDALAHGGAHGHAAPGTQSAASAGVEDRRGAHIHAPRGEQPRSVAHAAAPSHCPDDPFGACCCGHAALLHYVPALANADGEALIVTWPSSRYVPHLHDSGYRPAFFLLAAPPRAPPSPPVTV